MKRSGHSIVYRPSGRNVMTGGSKARVSLARFTFASFILTRYQFGEFLFGALPIRRVSLWRVSHFCANLR